jgi:hypothetical protein
MRRARRADGPAAAVREGRGAMRSTSGWLRPVCLAALIGLLACLQPAWAEPDAAAAANPAPSAPAQHGGGGFALLLLAYRLGLERLTEDLRERDAWLANDVPITA